jgi:hypothetical protein
VQDQKSDLPPAKERVRRVLNVVGALMLLCLDGAALIFFIIPLWQNSFRIVAVGTAVILAVTALLVFTRIAANPVVKFFLVGINFAIAICPLVINWELGSPTPDERHMGLIEKPFLLGLPRPSARFSIRLCESAGKTLGELSDNLCAALSRAGYTDRAIYPYQDGFAVLTRLEQRDARGNPSNDRWPNVDLNQGALPLSSLFSMDYIRALLFGKYGVYRFFIFTLTPEYPQFSSNETTPGISEELVIDWTDSITK